MAKRCCPTCGQELPKITMKSIKLPLLSGGRRSGTYLTVDQLGRYGLGIFWCNDEDGPGACIGDGPAKGTDTMQAELATAAEKVVQNHKDPDALSSLDFWAVELAAEELFHAKSDSVERTPNGWRWSSNNAAKLALRQLKTRGDYLMQQAVQDAIKKQG